MFPFPVVRSEAPRQTHLFLAELGSVAGSPGFIFGELRAPRVRNGRSGCGARTPSRLGRYGGSFLLCKHK